MRLERQVRRGEGGQRHQVLARRLRPLRVLFRDERSDRAAALPLFNPARFRLATSALSKPGVVRMERLADRIRMILVLRPGL